MDAEDLMINQSLDQVEESPSGQDAAAEEPPIPRLACMIPRRAE
jgi:hypothetical protein